MFRLDRLTLKGFKSIREVDLILLRSQFVRFDCRHDPVESSYGLYEIVVCVQIPKRLAEPTADLCDRGKHAVAKIVLANVIPQWLDWVELRTMGR